jgi:RNA-binding protein YhbY
MRINLQRQITKVLEASDLIKVALYPEALLYPLKHRKILQNALSKSKASIAHLVVEKRSPFLIKFKQRKPHMSKPG